MHKGYSLIELMLSIAIFAILATSSTIVLATTLRSTERALLTAKVRSEGTFIIDSMTQIIRFSPSATCPTSGPNAGDLVVASTNPRVSDAIFECTLSGTLGSIASNSAQLNSDEVDIESCSFACTGGTPSLVQVNYSIQDKDGDIDPIDFSTEIVLRNAQ